MIGIYKLSFEGTDKVYIGQSEDIEKRYKEHLAFLRKGLHSIKMNKAYAMFGIPLLEVLCECLVAELDEFEEETISIYNSVDNGFNTLYKPGDTPDNTGQLNGMSKYSKRLILRAFSLLYSTSKTLLEISKSTSIQISTLSSISNGSRHMYLKKEYPEQYDIMVKHRRALTVNTSIKYPPIIGPDNKIYYITNVKQFCREHPLLDEAGSTHLSEVIKGKRNSHKGFKLQNKESAIVKVARPTLVDPSGIEYPNITNITAFCNEHPLLQGNVNARKGLSRVFNKERDQYLGFHIIEV